MRTRSDVAHHVTSLLNKPEYQGVSAQINGQNVTLYMAKGADIKVLKAAKADLLAIRPTEMKHIADRANLDQAMVGPITQVEIVDKAPPVAASVYGRTAEDVAKDAGIDTRPMVVGHDAVQKDETK